jgi:hypothetical protein
MTGSTVSVVVTGSGIDSIYTSGASATERANTLKADATDPKQHQGGASQSKGR